MNPPLKNKDKNLIDPTINLEEEINRLRKEMNAVILSHYYQEDEIQDIADFIGDSLELSRKAAATDADVIIFCGVRFMADVAKMLSPEKKVFLPDINAGCSLEDSCKPEEFKKFIENNPGHIVLTYINSSAEVKALSDIIVTSSNAEYIINNIPEDQPIIFGPDKYLGGYLARKTGRKMLLWQGTCIVHENFSEKELIKLKTRYQNAHVIAHPECPDNLLSYADFVGSTSALLKFTKDRPKDSFIVLTEPGIVYQMRKYSPDAIFHDVPALSDGACASCNECPYMRLNTLEKLYLCMVNQSPEITMNEEMRKKSVKPIEKMLELSPPAR